MAKRRDPKSTAVMARRAPAAGVEADTPRQALHRTLDYFPTPMWATRAGAEILQALDPDCLEVLEPACGEGHMAGPLDDYFAVHPTDVHDHGWAKGWLGGTLIEPQVRDWLDDGAWGEDEADWVFTNPPFNLLEEFVTRGLERARRGVALLGRLNILEGVERYPLLAGPKASLTLVAPFSERVPMVLGKWDPTVRSATAYGFFFWMKGADPRPVHLIPPGTRERLWAREDAERYAWKEPMPLFPEWDVYQEGAAP